MVDHIAKMNALYLEREQFMASVADGMAALAATGISLHRGHDVHAVEIFTGEVVAYLCADCDQQLPGGWHP